MPPSPWTKIEYLEPPFMNPAPSLDDQLQAMAEHRAKTGAQQAFNAISRAENLLRRAFTPEQYAALGIVCGKEPDRAQQAQGMMSTGTFEYKGQNYVLFPYINDMIWSPEQVLEVLAITPPDKPLPLTAEPEVMTNILQQTDRGAVLVDKDIPEDKLYNRILELLLPQWQKEKS